MAGREDVAAAVLEAQQRASEPTIKPYVPSWRDQIIQLIMGDERPSPERRRFAEGAANVLDFLPGIGNALGIQEGYQKGDTEAMQLSMLPIPGVGKIGPAVRAADRSVSRRVAFATHEALPGSNTKHLPNLQASPPEVREAYSLDPRSSWATAPGGRDAIYAGVLGEERVLPTQRAQGFYMPDSGILETNPAQVARPFVSFMETQNGKTVSPADRMMLNAGETVRAAIDAQNAGAWHRPFIGGRARDSLDAFIPLERPATVDEMLALQRAGTPLGLTQPIDTGQGTTMTNFGRELPTDPKELAALGRQTTKNLNEFGQQASEILPDAEGLQRARVDSGFVPLDDYWKQGEGSRAVTEHMLGVISQTPVLRAAFDNNPYIPPNALARMERDAERAQAGDQIRQDIQNLRQIIGDGPGWVGRLEEAVRNKAIVPAAALAFFSAAGMQGQQPPDQGRGGQF